MATLLVGVLLSGLFDHALAQPSHAQLSTGDLGAAAVSSDHQAEVLSHDMEIDLDPDRHHLQVTDRVMIKAHGPSLSSLSFILNQALHVSKISIVGYGGKHLAFTTVTNGFQGHESNTQRVNISLDALPGAGQQIMLEWQYGGSINDPPREPSHLRFVTPSDTAGHIGPEGIYLSGETHWYPDLPGALPTFRMRVTTPPTWQAVTHGRQQSQAIQKDRMVSEWEIGTRTEALTVVANRFVKTQRDWQGIEIATYLFPEDSPLAHEYLDASVRYLETYTALLGPYPFPKFAVVENFFPSGLGMPSFTLLGSGTIKRHYIQPYALGHEIVHSWIGNWVFNRTDQGNWVEGLTTYLANYYYEELTGTAEQAREQRRLMTLGYAVYVTPEDDYPISRFMHKTDQKDNAIGYQKTAMVFHMLRREIGDELFWKGLGHLVSEYGGSYADWHDVERVFSTVGHTDLRWFFTQWIERAGAPIVRIQDARIQEESGTAIHRYVVRLHLVQLGTPYRIALPVKIVMPNDQPLLTSLRLDSSEEVMSLPVPARPVSVEIDPNFDAFHRLDREEIPPMLNRFVTDAEHSVLVPTHGEEEARQPYQELLKRLIAQDKTVSVMVDNDARPDTSVLVLGGPGVNGAVDWAVSGCRDRVSLEKDSVTIEGHTYRGPNIALLISCPHPEQPGRIATIFYGVSPSAAAKVARLLFFYGWQSYLIFQDGAVVARGNFSPVRNNLKVTF
ncbi:MAG TPA: M1 family aminopeptidase [Nitrospiraceae bacterium]|nr:M1 family aminopeptidase [Nitrospiraceae bacterium]